MQLSVQNGKLGRLAVRVYLDSAPVIYLVEECQASLILP